IPLLDDPEVQAAFAKWVDVPTWRKQLELARARRQAIWYGIWSETFHPLLGQALAGEISADDCLQQSADAWNELKSSVESSGGGEGCWVLVESWGRPADGRAGPATGGDLYLLPGRAGAGAKHAHRITDLQDQ